MSYTAQSRRVRDLALRDGARRRALGSCVTRFAPYGYTATLAFLEERCGRLDNPQNLIRAIDLLDASRAVWLAELTSFAAARTAAKAAGNRRPTSTELARIANIGWPGGTPEDPPVSRAFLRQFGLIAIAPEPVRLRRRIRWRDKRLATHPSPHLSSGAIARVHHADSGAPDQPRADGHVRAFPRAGVPEPRFELVDVPAGTVEERVELIDGCIRSWAE